MLAGMSEQSPDSKSTPTSKRKATAKAVIESAPGQAVTGQTDDVFPSKVVNDPNHRKSLTVHHLQRRLEEVGYATAAAGIDGRYDANTQHAFEAWQSDNGYEPGEATYDQLSQLFDGDPNVQVQHG